jgi:hypothetical protein
MKTPAKTVGDGNGKREARGGSRGQDGAGASSHAAQPTQSSQAAQLSQAGAAKSKRPTFDDCSGVGGQDDAPARATPPKDGAPRAEWNNGGGVVDRRLGLDRRDIADNNNPFDAQGFERRRGPGRRLSDFTRKAEEGEMTKEQFLFLMAIDAFKKANQLAYPTWTDVLEVIRLLGYRKTMPAEFTLKNAEDWLEAANAPTNVRSPRWAEHTQRDKHAA